MRSDAVDAVSALRSHRRCSRPSTSQNGESCRHMTGAFRRRTDQKRHECYIVYEAGERAMSSHL